MYKINQEQVEAIRRAFYECNVPVKMYEGVLSILNSLPKIEALEGKMAVNVEAEAAKE